MPNKQTLIDHIKNIILLAFGKEAENITINVFDVDNVSPEFISLTRNCLFDSLIVLKISGLIPGIKEKTNKLAKLLSKNVILTEKSKTIIIYWFDGLQDVNQKAEEHFYPKHDHPTERLKYETQLPNWLDKYIFEVLNARYEPNFEKFDYNLEHSGEELKAYLGTYFPRSYAESFCIYEGLFGNNIFISEIMKKKEINILDIGCGTGGNLLGLLTICNKYFTADQIINVWVIDGNQDALGILSKIIKKYKQNSILKINLNIISAKFLSISELKKIFHAIEEQNFDFIMSFKTICEIISKGGVISKNSYYEILEQVCYKLSNVGTFLLLDVTTKTIFTDYLPILFNEQARNFVKRVNDFKILSPLSCNCYGNVCNSQCFYQQDFLIRHSQKRNDVSRVAYKIIGRTEFVETVTKNLKKGKFVINWKHFSNELKNNGCCINTLQENEYLDAFKLS